MLDSGRSGRGQLARRTVFESLQDLADRVTSIEGMAKLRCSVHFVMIAAADPFDAEVATRLEFVQDPLHGTFGDADERSDVTLAQIRVPEQGQEYMCVVREEGPRGAQLVQYGASLV